MVGVVGRLVAPEDVVAGRLTSLLGVLWLTGGAWVLVGQALGVFAEGWSPGVLGVGVGATAIGAALLLVRQRRLGLVLDVSLTLLGSLAIALTVLWAGPRGAGVAGVLYVYVTCFAFVSLRRQAVAVTIVSAGMHLLALLAGGYAAAVGIWAFTWGSAIVAGAVVGAAVEWLRQFVRLLEEADAHKARFVGTVSHELRTPLTVILGSTETLQRGWDQLEERERRRFVEVIDRHASRQLRLVEDVMTMSTLMQGTITPVQEAIDVEGLVAEVVQSMPFDITVDVQGPLIAKVDPGHLQRVLGNLLINADRYGAPPILVRGDAHAGEVRLEVADHGSGITGGLAGDLLEPFVQGDSGDRRRSVGVGLGLTICRDLLEVNGGRLAYEDTPGGGATVRIHLLAA